MTVIERAGTPSVEALVVCPSCRSGLEHSPAALRCTSCDATYPRTRTDCLELMPPRSDQRRNEWAARQQSMERWYEEMVTTDWAQACFDSDYEPLRDVLSACQGTVLDLGGGAGVTRRYLTAATGYISLDPSLMWLGPEWEAFTSSQRPLPDSVFVQGTGEAIPVGDSSVDAVVALWSLNHVSDPRRVFEEVHRVLRPRGTFFIVLEDMEPTWLDMLTRRAAGRSGTGRQAIAKLRARLPGHEWELQTDHIRIRESDLAAWSARRFELRSRAWRGGYLTCDYVRVERSA